jgi:pyruvate dehydrogenase E2 component (dihydrolipoamide acetyltransferase)
MITEVLLPALGETMDTARIVRWLKQPGEHIAKGEPLFEIETDKATIEVEALADGILRRIQIGENSQASIGDVVALLSDQPDEPLPEVQATAAVAAPSARRQPPAAPMPGMIPAPPSQKLIASPRARRRAEQCGVDLSQVGPGSGAKGRIIEADVQSYLEASPATTAPRLEPLSPPDEERVLPLEGARRAIAERMARSAQTAPHFNLSLSVDMSVIEQSRQRLNAGPNRPVKVTPTAYLVKVCAWALERHPLVNASLQADGIHLHSDVHIGVAVARDDGLIVPVLRNAHRKNLEQIASELADLAARARSGRLKLDELSGGTFTISNLGMFGIDGFAAIINPPESAILAVGRILRTPVAGENDRVEVRPMLRMTLSCDHRVIDGAIGAAFLQDVGRGLENPWTMLA